MKIKIGDTSLLEIPVKILNLIPFVNAFHEGKSREPYMIEHVWGPLVVTMAASYIGLILKMFSWNKTANWLVIGTLVALFLAHVIWKEVWSDRKKNKAKPIEIRSRDFWAQIIERSSFIVFGSPFWVTVLLL